MPNLFTPAKLKKFKVAVSSCLVGNAVRYDGQHKRHSLIVDMLEKYFEPVVVCPEMHAGLGTPRPPVQLVQIGESVIAQGVEDKNLNVTALIEKVAVEFIAQYPDLSGIILQSRSPSCGYASTPLFTESNETIGFSSGIFTNSISMAYPGLPIKEDTWFVDKTAVENYVEQVWNFANSKKY